MCYLYNVTTTRDAVMVFTKALRDKAGWSEPSFDVYPNTLAPIVRVGEGGQREIVRATWGLPTPPRRHQHPKRELAALAALAGPDEPLRGAVHVLRRTRPRELGAGRKGPERVVRPEPRPAVDVLRGVLAAMEGRTKGARRRAGVRAFRFPDDITERDLEPIHLEAMPAILTTPEEADLWLMGSWDEVEHLQRPLPGNMLVVVEPPAQPKEDSLL